MSLLMANRALMVPDLSFKMSIDTSLGTGNTFTWPLPIGQTYNFLWSPGDGSPDRLVTAYDDVNATYDYGVPFNGQVAAIGKMGGFTFADGGDKLKVTSVDNAGDVGFVNITGMWWGCTNITTISMLGLDLSLAGSSSLASFARSCTSCTSIACDDWDVSGMQDASSFAFDTAVTSLPVGSWNTSSFTSVEAFARSCNNLTDLDVSNWNVSSIVTFKEFISSCTSLVSINTSNWITSSANSFFFFAINCSNLAILDVSGFDMSNVTTTRGMIQLTDIVIFNTDNWDTSAISTCQNMCFGCDVLTSSFDNTKWWNRTVPIGTFSNCFTEALNISNYASIPNNWKGL